MKLKKALKKMTEYLNSDRRYQLAQYDSIKKVLKKLKSKRNQLREKIAFIDNNQDEIHKANNSDERQKLQSKLDIVNAQRKKGVRLMKELKSIREDK
ncbi:MAG: hypothetical protein KUG82_13280 [Pseudomonadales bacterium]|nr:hypothetical protein [Pseudomonadales bacterium]